MSSKQKLTKALAVVLPAGAVGASLVLALAPAQAATLSSVAGVATPATPQTVAGRLAAIRAGVSDAIDSPVGAEDAGCADDEAGGLIPTWWANGGWGRFGLGWGNGGWNNWGNGWNNFWHNA